MRLLMTIFAAGLAASCTTLSGATLVKSEPAGALVIVEGYGECETPCRVKLDNPRMTTVAKAGYEKQRFVLVPGRPKVSVVLELAAPTKDVEENELPDL